MISKHSRNTNFAKTTILLLVMLLIGSCTLFKKKCPLPTCEIRKSHRHLLIFTKEPKAKKVKKSKKNNLTDSTAISLDSLGSEESHEGHDHEGHNHEDHEATYVEVDGEVLDEEGNVYVDPKEQKKIDKKKRKAEKKAAKKKKKEDRRRAKNFKDGLEEDDSGLDTDIDIEEEDSEFDGMTEDEYKEHRVKEHEGDTITMHTYDEKKLAKQLKAEDKAAKKAEKKELKKARKGKKGQDDYTKLYRSRITKWWRKDQNPKVGKYFKRKKNKSTKIG